MQTYIILRDFRFRGVTYRKSKTDTQNTIELDSSDSETEKLLARGFIVPGAE